MTEIERAIRLIADNGLGRTAPNGLAGLITSAEPSEIHCLCQGGTLEYASERADFTADDLVGGPCVVFDNDVFGDLIDDFGPENVFETFLKNAYVGIYEKQSDEATLVSTDSLWALFPRYVPSREGIPTVPQCMMWDTEHVRLEGVQEFCGTHAVCEFTVGDMYCGEKMCHAEHSWVRDGICLCYMSSGGFVTQFHLYPFRTRL